MVKSTACSSRPGSVPGTHKAAQTLITPIPGNLMPSSGLLEDSACRWFKNIHASQISIHTKRKKYQKYFLIVGTHTYKDIPKGHATTLGGEPDQLRDSRKEGKSLSGDGRSPLRSLHSQWLLFMDSEDPNVVMHHSRPWKQFN